MKIPLRGSPKAISEKRSAHARGFAFQDWLRDFLVSAKFEIERNPKAARPRQTDVYATNDDDEYLIEAKWQSKRSIPVTLTAYGRDWIESIPHHRLHFQHVGLHAKRD